MQSSGMGYLAPFDLAFRHPPRDALGSCDIDAAHRAFVFDYKYSNAQNTKGKLENQNLLQAPLYLMAAERSFGVKPALCAKKSWPERSISTDKP